MLYFSGLEIILTLPHGFRNQALFNPIICHPRAVVTAMSTFLSMVFKESTCPAMITRHAIGRY